MSKEEILKEIELLFSNKKYIPIKHGKGDEEFWKGVEIARQVYYKRLMEILNKDGFHKK